MPFTDSIDKIVTSYFAAITRSPFTYKGKGYAPKDLIVSPLLFRGFTCPESCGGCCPRFSLDYLPEEQQPYGLAERIVKIHHPYGDITVPIYSDEQTDHQNHHCRNLIKDNGRCGIHGRQPFSCDFELIRCIHYEHKTVLTQKLFGRGWAFLRTDGERGARCEMTPVDKETIKESIRKLIRLKTWAEHFKITHCLNCVIRWAEKGIHDQDLVIKKDQITRAFQVPMSEFTEPLVRIEK